MRDLGDVVDRDDPLPAEFADPSYETVYLNLIATMEMPAVGERRSSRRWWG